MHDVIVIGLILVCVALAAVIGYLSGWADGAGAECERWNRTPHP